MVRIAEEPEGDPTERLNLDDYNSDDFDEYLSNNMETTLPTIIEAQATTKEDLPAPLPPAVTITVQLDEQHPAEDQAERLPGGVGRPPGSAEPGLAPVQVHFEEEWLPRHLITFHICVGGKPTSKSYK